MTLNPAIHMLMLEFLSMLRYSCLNSLGLGCPWLQKLLEPGRYPTLLKTLYGLLMLLPQVIYSSSQCDIFLK